ncbi:MAG: hypothetical protein F6J95_000435 [Leptolyngbya sp. SIO1E4]|nr:hypothetical protein [Leptolyngbya sp. SIO1E4]
MASIRRIFLLASGATTALVAAFPAQAEDLLAAPSAMAESTETTAAVESEAAATSVETTELETHHHLTHGSVATILPTGLDHSKEINNETHAATQQVDQPSAAAAIDVSTVTFEGAASTSAETFFTETEVAETPVDMAAGQEVAQVTRPLYRGVSPFYVGIGGNIGIVDSDESAIGDFGFNVISKISLGPRFSVRPMASISEDDFSLAIPLTYNFNPVEIGELNVYPALGAGVDIADDIGLLVNGSVDLPISREFTLNGQLNWRATNDTGLGLSLGIGYNFPFFFE